MVRQEDKAKIRNVKVITSEECVPKHKLLVMDMRFKATNSLFLKSIHSLSLPSVILIDSSMGSSVHVLIQAVHGLHRLRAPGIVPLSPGNSLVS